MDWKEFFRPTWKKIIVFLAAYLIITPILLLIFSKYLTPTLCGESIINWIQCLTVVSLMQFGLFFIPVAALQGGNIPVFLVSILLIALMFAIYYILSCSFLHFISKKSDSPAMTKKYRQGKPKK